MIWPLLPRQEGLACGLVGASDHREPFPSLLYGMKNTEDFTMKKHLNNFPEHSISIESYNDLLNPCYDSILQFGDRVLVTKTNWKGGVEAAVYGFAEDPKEGLSSIECRLELLKISDEVYTDAGHAMEWCIRNAH